MTGQIPKPKSDEEGRALINHFAKTYAASLPKDNSSHAFSEAVICTAATIETDSTPATATFELKVPLSYRNNPYDMTTHGGSLAIFFDNTTSMPLFLVRRDWDGATGVTRNFNITYFRPVMAGETVIIETEVLQYGKTNAMIKGVMRRKRDGVVLALCQHEKVRSNTAKVVKL